MFRVRFTYCCHLAVCFEPRTDPFRVEESSKKKQPKRKYRNVRRILVWKKTSKQHPTTPNSTSEMLSMDPKKNNIEAVFLHFKSSAIFVESQSHLCKHKTCSVRQDCFNETNRHNKRNLSIWLIPVPLQLWINQRPNGGLRLCSYRWSIFGYISDDVLLFFRCCKISIRFLIKHSAEHCSLKINHSKYLAGLFVFGAYVLSIK